ncbi:MAG: aspartate-semialdehyde dehydrogenase [Bdellovibrionales bacterium]
MIVTCQGGDYSKEIHKPLRASGWKGYWVDAASALRMEDSSTLILDPINKNVIDNALNAGTKDFIGANCTVSLLLMAIGGLLKEDLVEWVSTMTYQAASGAGARHMKELVEQWQFLSGFASDELNKNDLSILDLDQKVMNGYEQTNFPKENFGFPLAGNLLPWIDSAKEQGETREEWKAQVEANKILGRTSQNQVYIDGTCVRIGSLRCHSQGAILKLKKSVDLQSIHSLIAETSSWTEIVENDKQNTCAKLTPVYASGTLKIPVGRIRKAKMGEDYLNLFTVGDQLLWGAAEPLRRFINLL